MCDRYGKVNLSWKVGERQAARNKRDDTANNLGIPGCERERNYKRSITRVNILGNESRRRATTGEGAAFENISRRGKIYPRDLLSLKI